MPLGSIHCYLLLSLSGIVMLMQTAVTAHSHQPGSYYDARSTLHAPMSHFMLELTDFIGDSGETGTTLPVVPGFASRVATHPDRMSVMTRHDPSPSRAPPCC